MTDLFVPGDQVGQCLTLNGSPIDFICAGSSANRLPQPAKTFEVVKRLGVGSYATVYLVRENVKPAANRHVAEPVRRRHYALKCLAKDEIDGVAVDAQMAEVTSSQKNTHHRISHSLFRSRTKIFYLSTQTSSPFTASSARRLPCFCLWNMFPDMICLTFSTKIAIAVLTSLQSRIPMLMFCSHEGVLIFFLRCSHRCVMRLRCAMHTMSFIGTLSLRISWLHRAGRQQQVGKRSAKLW